MITIVTLSRFPDIFSSFSESVERHEPSYDRIVVTSGNLTINRLGWTVIRGIEPFQFARNANLGIAAAAPNDVLLVNDDVQFIYPVIYCMSEIARKTGAAVISPQIIGDGINNRIALASYRMTGRFELTCQKYIPFVCVLLPRAKLDVLGPLSERFDGYGGEDVEFGARALAAGLPLAVCNCHVRHGHGKHTYSSSFLRIMTDEERGISAKCNETLALALGNKECHYPVRIA